MIRDGDKLPMIGGPRDGETQAVNFIFRGSMMPKLVRFGDDYYCLDVEARCWRWVERKEESPA